MYFSPATHPLCIYLVSDGRQRLRCIVLGLFEALSRLFWVGPILQVLLVTVIAHLHQHTPRLYQLLSTRRQLIVHFALLCLNHDCVVHGVYLKGSVNSFVFLLFTYLELFNTAKINIALVHDYR